MKKRRFLDYAAGAVQIYLKKRVGRSAAALAYSLTLSVFPLLICLSGILGLQNLNPATLQEVMHGLLPEGVLQTLQDFLIYVTENSTLPMFIGGVVLLVTTSAMAYRTIAAAMADIHGEPRYAGLTGSIFSFAFSLIFLAVIYVSVIIIVTGRWFIRLISQHFDLGAALFNWEWMRFLLMFLILFLILSIIYRLTVPREKPARHVLTGACIASAALVIVSIAFSSFIGLSSRYPLVYGSLASIVILMIWFYVCGIVLISGGIINLMIYRAEQGLDPLYEPPPRRKEKLSLREQLFGQRRRPRLRPEQEPEEQRKEP